MRTDRIEASFDELFKQATMTAHDYMLHARSHIDGLFGTGYAQKNPGLVAAYMQIACADFIASSTAKVLQDAPGRLAYAIMELAGGQRRSDT